VLPDLGLPQQWLRGFGNELTAVQHWPGNAAQTCNTSVS